MADPGGSTGTGEQEREQALLEDNVSVAQGVEGGGMRLIDELRCLKEEAWGYPTRAFLICLVGASLANMDQALFGFVLTPISREFGWTVVERGWYLALTFAVAGSCIAGFGILADRIGRKAVFEASILVSSLFVTSLRWVPNTLWLLLLRTLGFATGGIQSPVTGTIVVEESPPAYRGLMAGVLQIGYPVGWFLASVLAAPIITHWGWRHIFYLGLLSIPYMIVVKRYLRETGPFLESRDSARNGSNQARFRDLFGPDYRLRTAVLFTGEFLHVFAYGATILLTSYFVEGRDWKLEDAILIVGYTFLVGSIGYVVSSIVGEFYITRRNVIILWSTLGSVAFAAMIWLAHSWWAVFLTYSLMTIFFYGTTAVKFTFIAENFPARLRATGVTFAGSLAVNLGVAFGPLALSYVVHLAGWNIAYTLCGVLPVLASGLIFLVLDPIPRGAEVD
jgi:putative MFS transporter